MRCLRFVGDYEMGIMWAKIWWVAGFMC